MSLKPEGVVVDVPADVVDNNAIGGKDDVSPPTEAKDESPGSTRAEGSVSTQVAKSRPASKRNPNTHAQPDILYDKRIVLCRVCGEKHEKDKCPVLTKQMKEKAKRRKKKRGCLLAQMFEGDTEDSSAGD